VADVRISVEGRDSDYESLWDWLRAEPELRGHLCQGEARGPDGAMGVLPELTIGVISSGAATALASALKVWLVQRRADVTLNISGPHGRQVVLDAKRAPDAERLLTTALGWVDGGEPGTTDGGLTPPAADSK
jgi:Effector Associated Constant Component 1